MIFAFFAEDLASLFAGCGQMPITALKASRVQACLAQQESLAPATYNRRLAALWSFTRWLCDQRWLADALLKGVEQLTKALNYAKLISTVDAP